MGGGEGSDENKIIFTLPYERMFMSFVGNECKRHRPAGKKNILKGKEIFSISERKADERQGDLVGTYLKYF